MLGRLLVNIWTRAGVAATMICAAILSSCGYHVAGTADLVRYAMEHKLQ